MKQNEVRDSKNKENIQKLNLDKLMNQLITRMTDFKDQQLKIKKSKTDKLENKTNDDNKNENKSEEKSDDKSDKNNEKSNERQNSDFTDTLKDLKKNDKNNYDYCNSLFHKENKCKLKNSIKQSE